MQSQTLACGKGTCQLGDVQGLEVGQRRHFLKSPELQGSGGAVSVTRDCPAVVVITFQ